MERFIIFAISVSCIAFGFSFTDRGPMPMAITTSGKLLYPISSGSDDMAVLSLGLMTFFISAIYTPISSLLKQPLRYLAYVYFFNMLLFIFFVFLVTLDASFIFAAEVGDTLPLISVLLAFTPIILVGILHLTNKSMWTK